MKNKLLMILIPSMFVLPAFSVDWQTELKKQFISETSIQLGSYEAGNLYIRKNDFLNIEYRFEYGFEFSYEKSDLPLQKNIFLDFELHNDGYLYGRIANEPFSSIPIKEVPLIFGDEFSFAMPGMTTSWLKVGTKEYEEELYRDGTYKRKEKIIYPDTGLFNYVIKKVISSSHLVETSHGIEFDYSGLNLDIFLTHPRGYWAHDLMELFCFPWVENAADSGIGEWIEFDLSSPQSTTYILNGFVDGNRMHLYKANSRMKEAEFTGWTESGKEIKQNVHFEDFVYFKTVQFSEPVTKFRITIKETYPGEKWQDTAISAVMFPVLNK